MTDTLPSPLYLKPGSNFYQKIKAALGLPDLVIEFSIVFPDRDFVRVECKYLAPKEGMNEIAEILEQFHLSPIQDRLPTAEIPTELIEGGSLEEWRSFLISVLNQEGKVIDPEWLKKVLEAFANKNIRFGLDMAARNANYTL
jgi:hypothetical protein